MTEDKPFLNLIAVLFLSTNSKIRSLLPPSSAIIRGSVCLCTITDSISSSPIAPLNTPRRLCLSKESAMLLLVLKLICTDSVDSTKVSSIGVIANRACFEPTPIVAVALLKSTPGNASPV